MIKTESFNRPTHPDFMDSTELAKIEFSGTRVNSLTHDYEIWMKGEIIERVTEEQLRLNPLAINQAMEKAFDIEKVMPDTPEAHRYMAILERQEAYNETIEQLGGIPNEADYAINGSPSHSTGEGTESGGDSEEDSPGKQEVDWESFLQDDEEPLIDEAFDYDELDGELDFPDEDSNDHYEEDGIPDRDRLNN